MRRFQKSSLLLILSLLAACAGRPDVHRNGATPAPSSAPPPAVVNPKALEHFMNGETLLMQGNHAMAALEFQDAVEADPTSATLWCASAQAYLYLGKLPRAEESVNRALGIDSVHQEALELSAQIYLVTNRPEKAEARYGKLAQLHPERKEYAYALGEIARRQGRLEDAQKCYWQIFENDSREVEAAIRAAAIAEERQDFLFASKTMSRLTDLRPENPAYWNSLAELLVRQGRLEEAIGAVERVIEHAPGDSTAVDRLAGLYYDLGRTDEAKAFLDRLHSSGHRTAASLYYLGRIALDKEDDPALERYGSEMIERFPEEVAGYTHLTLAHLHQERPLEAIETLLRAREKFPQEFSINYLLGSSYSDVKNFDLAKNSLQMALEISPSSRPAKHLLATVHSELKEWKYCDSLYEDLIGSDTADFQAMNNFSYTLAERGIRLRDALLMSEKAVAAEPDNAAYLDTIGWIHFQMGQLGEAAEYVQRSVDVDGTSAVVHEHLGDILDKLQKKDEALGHYQKAFQLDPMNEQLRSKAAGTP